MNNELDNFQIALLGYSIGTVATIYMASKHPPNLCGIVLVAPLTSGLRLYLKAKQTCCMDRFLRCIFWFELEVFKF